MARGGQCGCSQPRDWRGPLISFEVLMATALEMAGNPGWWVLNSLCAHQMPDFLSGRVREGWDQGPLPHLLVPGSSQVVLGVPGKSAHLQPKCDSRAETEVATARPVWPSVIVCHQATGRRRQMTRAVVQKGLGGQIVWWLCAGLSHPGVFWTFVRALSVTTVQRGGTGTQWQGCPGL